MRWLPLVAAAGLVAAPAAAAHLTVTIEIPRQNVAEYHQPYVAVWIERPDRTAAATLSVWYLMRGEKNEGVGFLRDLRQWWRRAGRELTLPIDGVTGATRGPGRHTMAIDASRRPLALLPGPYRLMIEAAREAGGREMLEVPFTWPPAAPMKAKASGMTELGAVLLDIRP